MRVLLAAIVAGSVSLSLTSMAGVPAHEVSVSNDVTTAEYNRLSDRLSRLVKKGQWAGADRIYRELKELNLPLSFSELLICAELERRAGDLQSTYECLRSAAKVEGTREVIDWLVTLEENTGEVKIYLERGQSGELLAAQPVFLPEHQAALDFAAMRLSSTRQFEGRLPVGSYSIGELQFEVTKEGDVEVGRARP